MLRVIVEDVVVPCRFIAPVPSCHLEANICTEDEIRRIEPFMPLLVKLSDQEDEIPKLFYYMNHGMEKTDGFMNKRDESEPIHAQGRYVAQ